jgi:hypothetical protein
MMLSWILISSVWVGLLVLILHDATKDDADGGAVRVAGKNLGVAVNGATLGIRKLPKALHHAIPQTSASNLPQAVQPKSRPSDPIRQPSLIERALGVVPKRKSWQKNSQTTLSISELELAITEAVQNAAPECETFLGVILEKKTPRSRRGANWQLRGAKFGKADRKIASEALATIIERMQQDVCITDERVLDR